VDIKVAVAARDFVDDVPRALETLESLLTRLHIAHRPKITSSRTVQLVPGFIPMPPEVLTQLNHAQRAHYRPLEVRGETYLLERTALQDNPYYRLRVQMLEDGVEALECRLEAHGFTLAIHEQAFTFAVEFITLEPVDRAFGTFIGQLVDFGRGDPFPSSEIEERTGLWGPLVHMEFVECLAALKRAAIPSLVIRDPSGYAEQGDAFALLEAMNLAGYTYDAVSQWIGLELPDIQDKQQFIPNLSGAVGSEERINQLEAFLFTNGIAPVDIDDLLERGR
jgi:hypothetical protein